jgi:protein SCO1/2
VVSDEKFRGRYMLVFFGYTYCPDVCPAGLQVMTSALEELGSAADNIQPLFITIDPKRDTVPVMASYVENFHPRLIGLTGTPQEIGDIAKAYRVYFKKAGDDADYLMDHSSILYLMGPKGEFVKHFAYGTDVAALAKEIKKAISAN